MTLGLEKLTPADASEVLSVRTLLLLLVAVCGYGAQLLVERQHQTELEAGEFQLREGQLRSTGRLAAEIAHQLKNPLAIINNTTFSLQKAVNSNREDIPRLAGIIREEVERADRILNQVMNYGRLAEGVVEKLDASVELDAVIKEVLPEPAGFKIKVSRSYAKGLPPVMMQRAHLREALANLLTNARDALGERGEIKVQTRSTSNDSVEIVVEDNGPGIPDDQLSRIFEAYFTTKAKGTGLGLAIARNNVELYGGQVSVDSDLGIGSRFTLFLPTRLSKPTHL